MGRVDIDNAQIRHINMSGDMYSRLVFGEEGEDGNYLFQKSAHVETGLPARFLNKIGKRKTNYLMPRFRKINRTDSYIYIVSLWGNIDERKSILRQLYKMRRKYGNILIVGYWGDPGFDLDAYEGYEFDLLITSQEPHTRRWDGLHYLHFPVASLGLLNERHKEKFDCFSIGTYSDLRLSKIINSEEQFHKFGIDCYYCISGMQPSDQQSKRIEKIKKHREFPDRDFMSPDENLKMCASTRVLLNISRLPEAYEASPSFYAIMLNKKLIIDSHEIKKNPYYDPNNMKIVDFTDPNWLTPTLAEWIKTSEEINYGYKGEWEPGVFYRSVRSLLKEN